MISGLQLDVLGVKKDEMTSAQKKYSDEWREGT
jgi:S-adenosylhomocysteine hydrolase